MSKDKKWHEMQNAKSKQCIKIKGAYNKRIKDKVNYQ